MKHTKAVVGIIGFGEVGQALARFYSKPRIVDLQRHDDLSGVAILHVCIPYSRTFVKIVKSYIKTVKPKLTIIHSTVPVGTTKRLGSLVVHSPVRGVHPHLYEGIKTFVKYIGADNKLAARRAQSHLKSLGIRTQVFSSSRTTELGKLLDTTYYGLCIAFHGEMAKLCRQYHLDFDQVVTQFNLSYNQGYTKLGMPQVVRPVLRPPVGTIGGHCILQNVELLKKNSTSTAFALIQEYRPRKNKQKK